MQSNVMFSVLSEYLKYFLYSFNQIPFQDTGQHKFNLGGAGSESSYSGRPGKSSTCRACDDFKTWAKMKRDQKPDSEAKDEVRKIITAH